MTAHEKSGSADVVEPDSSPEDSRPAEPELETPAQIEIGGVRYDVPKLDTLDLDEEQILFDISGIVQADFMPAHPEASPDIRAAVDLAIAVRIRNPAFKRALAAIAYRRGNPDTPFERLETIVGNVNALDAEIALQGKDPYAHEEEDADPIESSAA